MSSLGTLLLVRMVFGQGASGKCRIAANGPTIGEIVDREIAKLEAAAKAESGRAAELDAMRKELHADAERYRWLRTKTAGLRDNEGRQYFSFPSMFGLRPVGNIMQGSVGQHLDAAIDAAMANAQAPT